jgi:hypothetical protein
MQSQNVNRFAMSGFFWPSKLNASPQKALRLIAIMVNRPFHMPKRPLRHDVAACIAFCGIPTHKAGHLLPESLQRFRARFRGLFGTIWFRPSFASRWVFL